MKRVARFIPRGRRDAVGEEPCTIIPSPLAGEGYDCMDAGGRAMHGAIAEGEGKDFEVKKLSGVHVSD